MVIAGQNQNTKFNSLCLYLLVVTTLIGPMVYIGFASLYHFVVAGLLLIALLKGINTAILRTEIVGFLALWFIEALISVLWAPDKELALQYVYYIFLILGVCVVFHYYLRRDNLEIFTQFMVLVLLACNLIGIWEMTTGNHLVKNYLSTPIRQLLMKYMPGGFYRNPNDFATYIIQAIPFSFVSISSSKRWVRILSSFNIIASFVVICAAESRAQILLLLAMCIFFVLVNRKVVVIKFVSFAALFAIILYFAYPEFKDLINDALKSITSASLSANAAEDGSSLSIRINLLKNAVYILRDSFCFGIGAGCHRAVMAAYSTRYYNVGAVRVMHNLPAEIFTDYGVLVGVAFFATIVQSCRRLVRIYKTHEDDSVRMLAIMLAFFMGGFILCGMSSSSILQITSVWMMFCFTSAFIRLYSPD